MATLPSDSFTVYVLCLKDTWTLEYPSKEIHNYAVNYMCINMYILIVATLKFILPVTVAS